MRKTRREFMKDAAIAGTVAATVSMGINTACAAEAETKPAETKKCPYFDQPLMCGGPGPDGKFKCE